jgi:putative flippase GtrA
VSRFVTVPQASVEIVHSAFGRGATVLASLVHAHLPRLSRYTLVSVAALGLDFAVFQSLTVSGVKPALAAIVGYTFGMLLHYTLSVRFVFADATVKSRRRTLIEFVASGLIGLAMTAAIVWIATAWLGIPALVAKALAVGASFIAVFLLRSAIVFKPAAALT